jgi:hypothetical protein
VSLVTGQGDGLRLKRRWRNEEAVHGDHNQSSNN